MFFNSEIAEKAKKKKKAVRGKVGHGCLLSFDFKVNGKNKSYQRDSPQRGYWYGVASYTHMQTATLTEQKTGKQKDHQWMQRCGRRNFKVEGGFFNKSTCLGTRTLHKMEMG